MKNLINKFNVEDLSAKFVSSSPFDHIIIDNFLVDDFAKKLRQNFPSPNEKLWWMYDNPLEKKLAFNKIEELNDNFFDYFSLVNSQEFLNWLTSLTKIKRLKSDPSLNGGGLHLIKKGGKLDVHEDYNIHKELMMLRKVNLILYLNENWQEEWGGHLELWDKDMKNLCQKISPIFNRAVIFRTDMGSNHGHPHPLSCPDNNYRISLATYYYVEHPNINEIPYRSTSYKKLPNNDDGLDDLRELRKIGRLENLTTNK
ncbi:MAG: 2OG-Fe(II) oxygenase [Proteobacteria bacterium]|nr:2OG-Fe(II) oxygenase [Pseudomonadota bacterium]